VVFDFYGVGEKQIVHLDLKDLPTALQYKQVTAVAVIGPNGAGPIADAIEAFRSATKRPPKFLEIPEAAAIAGRFTVYQEAEISSGAFGGSPVVPSEKVGTLSTNMPSSLGHRSQTLQRGRLRAYFSRPRLRS
jgi:hypothetical protein